MNRHGGGRIVRDRLIVSVERLILRVEKRDRVVEVEVIWIWR